MKIGIQQVETNKFGPLVVFWILKITNRGRLPVYLDEIKITNDFGGEISDKKLKKDLLKSTEDNASLKIEPNQTLDYFLLRADSLKKDVEQYIDQSLIGDAKRSVEYIQQYHKILKRYRIQFETSGKLKSYHFPDVILLSKRNSYELEEFYHNIPSFLREDFNVKGANQNQIIEYIATNNN